jgi:RNA polymerase sigma-70 factor, ECF subfamily
MSPQERQDMFCDLLALHQGQLHGYILALVRNRADADDLFQTTSLVLWRKFDSFDPGSSFFAWARRTAELTVCNFLRANRARFTPLSEAFLEKLAAVEPAIPSDDVDLYLAGLRHCVDKLGREDREMLGLCYVDDLSIRQIAERLARPRKSVGNSLLRIRRGLFRCIERQLAQEEHP